MNPTISLFTIAYHSTVLLLARDDSSAMYSVPAVALAYLLSLAWLGAFSVMVIIAYGNHQSGEINVFGFNIQFPTSTRETQQLQFILTPTEFSLLGDLAIRSTVQRRRDPCLCSCEM